MLFLWYVSWSVSNGRVKEMRGVEVLTAARAQDFYDWRAGEPQVHIGSGKYGRVYSSGRSAVLKESVTRAGLCKQAFREHVMGLLQTLLVLQACTPHLPLHYGTSIVAEGVLMRGHMYMERFEGSLIDLRGCLRTESDWLSLLFQLLLTFVALALLFGVTHNDAYPRNILINSQSSAPRVIYRCQEKSYALEWSFMAALTDFGIATTPLLMGHRSAPEVAERLEALELPPDFASTPPRHHILRYKSLPLFLEMPTPFSNGLALIRACPARRPPCSCGPAPLCGFSTRYARASKRPKAWRASSTPFFPAVGWPHVAFRLLKWTAR